MMEIGYQVGQTIMMENSRQNAEQDRDNQQPVFCLCELLFHGGSPVKPSAMEHFRQRKARAKI
ncbi:hypothetical protein [Citrobacter portucalensis]|uniref:hypothetical protein n=1 Tax=Citrobacter portucalensis TaxID=1639133 RepID=UPI003A8BCA6D